LIKPSSLKLEELSWSEIKNLISEGWTKTIIPLGATEQHGPGLPQGVDTWHGEETALRAASKLGKTLVAPAVPFGYSPEHIAFPGTISIREKTLSYLLEDIAESLARSGFTFVYFWFGHGGDWSIARKCLPPLRHRWPGCVVTYTQDVGKYVSETWDTLPLKEGIKLEISGSHAGEFEASMIAAIRPDLLKKDYLAEGDPRPLNQILEPMMKDGIHTISKNGVLGDQRFANAERGKKYLDCLADWLVEDIKRQLAVNE
jgi:creatinine amidohydrolase/Fe(II)-dependent formamide hydrolase-like protein